MLDHLSRAICPSRWLALVSKTNLTASPRNLNLVKQAPNPQRSESRIYFPRVSLRKKTAGPKSQLFDSKWSGRKLFIRLRFQPKFCISAPKEIGFLEVV